MVKQNANSYYVATFCKPDDGDWSCPRNSTYQISVHVVEKVHKVN